MENVLEVAVTGYAVATMLAVVAWWWVWLTDRWLEFNNPFYMVCDLLGGTLRVALCWPFALIEALWSW